MTVKNSSALFTGKVDKFSPMITGGKGNMIVIENAVTHEKKDVFDAMGGAAVLCLGHSDDEIIAAMGEAAKTSSYSYPLYMTNYHAEELARYIIDNSPEGVFESVLFTCSGSESNENGMKTVRQYWLEKGEPDRKVFISRKQSYHGYTTGTLALSDNAKKGMFIDVCMDDERFRKVSPCYPYRDMKDGETEADYCGRLLKEIEDSILEAGPKNVACIMLETMGGSTFGTCPPVAGYLSGIRKICDKYGVLMWLDEVMCGTGRASATGGFHCWESFPDFSGPDLQSIGKTLGGGFVTIAGLLVSPKVKKAFVEGSNQINGAQTYHQHAFNCQVALAVQKKCERLGLKQNSYDMGMLIGKGLKERAGETKIIGDVRGLGGFWSVEIVKDKATKETFPKELMVGPKLSELCLKNGMTTMGLTGTAGNGVGDHLTVAPTFILSREDVLFIVDTMIKSIKEFEAQMGL